MKRLQTAVALYLAVVAHLIVLLGLALAPWGQLPGGNGVGLGEGEGEGGAAGATATGEDQGAPIALAPSPPALTESQTMQAPAPVVSHAVPAETAPVEATDMALATPDKAATAAPAASQNQASRKAPGRPGTGGLGGGSGGYFAQLRQHLSRYRESVSGVSKGARADVAFTVAANGAVSEVRLVRSSGQTSLDNEALANVLRASPLPAPPNGRAMQLVVPILVDAR